TVGKYITIADNVGFRPQNVTVSAWCTFTGSPFSTWNCILAKNAGTGPYESIGMNYYSGDWYCNIGDPSSGSAALTPPVSIIINQWYHVVYQFDDINNVQSLYVNGVFAGSLTTISSIGYDTKPWTIGMEYNNSAISCPFNGKIDD